ncbi:hypothetical protein AR457_10390 [Streptomyces agglomeratus]|nr:hypothetical protein BGK70_26265 [Streptomyces agglomeratus]OEJ44454.1 hypothetical protein AR457_10390 [Streptomyces agglomeratus]
MVDGMTQLRVTALMEDGQTVQVSAITAFQFQHPWTTLESGEGGSEDEIRKGLAEKLRAYLEEHVGRALVLRGPDSMIVCPPGQIPYFRVR